MSDIFLFVVFVGKILIVKLAIVIKMFLVEYMSKKFTIAIIANVGPLLSDLIAEVGAATANRGVLKRRMFDKFDHKFKDNKFYNLFIVFIGCFFAIFLVLPDAWRRPAPLLLAVLVSAAIAKFSSSNSHKL